MSDFKATFLKDTYDNTCECTPLKQLKVATTSTPDLTVAYE